MAQNYLCGDEERIPHLHETLSLLGQCGHRPHVEVLVMAFVQNQEWEETQTQ